MGRRALIIAVVLGIACWWRGRHDLARHALGGGRCRHCGRALADIGEAFGDDAYVHPMRRTYDRKHGTLTRSGWEH